MPAGYLDFLWLILLGMGVVLITRFLLINGIQLTSDAWAIPRKMQGQIMGYATSAPELVGTVSTAAKGLLGAGLWNVTASNIINLVLFLAAAIYFGRSKALVRRKFADEIGFALGAIVLPIILVTREQWAKSKWAALVLFGFFVVYVVLDNVFNRSNPDEEDVAAKDPSKGPKGIVCILLGIAGIIIAGNYLGIVAESIVTQMSVPEWAVGWILGVITSLPEMTSFYAVFALAKEQGGDESCQQNLDNLAASNMSNVGLIYPIGIVVYLLASR
jgi:Ca2+/Na+ antiporter|tara:strand:+ start:1169 stop:1987 length:819 start_codon:yes stop_codon:yes gene_type:complete